MAQISANKQKLQNAANNLQNIYTVISQTGSQAQLYTQILEDQEKKFVEEGLIPYLKEVIEEAAQVLCVPISITANYKPDKGVGLDVDIRTAPRVIKVQPTPQPRPRQTGNNYPRAKGPNHSLSVNVGNGTTIKEPLTAETFTKAIIYAMEKVGPDKVADAIRQNNIQLDQEYLVKKGSFSSPQANSRELMQGYYTNTHSNTVTKQRQLERISEILNLHWIVTID